MPRAPMLVAAVSAAVACTVLPPSAAVAVTGGDVDGNQHPYVGTLIAPGATTPSCTVVLVRNDNGAELGLTDAHCLFRNQRYTGTGAAATFDAAWTATARRYSANWYVDPAYNPQTHEHDVAALVFSSAPPVAPASLAAPTATPSAARSGSVTAVGTGAPYPGQRRLATEVVTGFDDRWLYLRPGSGNTCDGDSGGPDLLPGTSTVLALTSQGSCTVDEDTRVDTARAHAFADAATRWPHAAPGLTVTLSSSTTRVGGVVSASGATSRLYSGDRVLRQGYYGGAWHTWATTTVSRTGRYWFTIHPTVATVDLYRIYLPATATHPAGRSATVSLLVSR